MNDILLKVDEMIKESKSIPEELKGYIVAICKAYIRNSNGMISLKGVENVCNTNFVKINENDKEFATENNVFGETDTKVLITGDIIHTMSYVNASNLIKLIMILTHELGHVMTEHKVNKVLENGSFPFMKRTATYYNNSYYKEDVLLTEYYSGFRLSDGFLETVCDSIFEDNKFREEIKLCGCDLKDYYYKDKRLFSSRIYDEFKFCFQLFDEIMDGKLFEFACMNSNSNDELIEFLNAKSIEGIYSISNIYKFIDKTLESLWNLKKYENVERDSDFDLLVLQYFKNKEELLMVADILSEHIVDKTKINELSFLYADMTKFGNTLPFNNDEIRYFEDKNFCRVNV